MSAPPPARRAFIGGALSSAGLAVLGSQGDIWDAQKDMLLDGLGSIMVMFIFGFVFKNEIAKLSDLKNK